MSIMEIKQVGYSYDNKKKVLKGVNAEMEQGKLYAILGPSGCGKTTLLSLIGGLDSPGSGQICFDGQDILVADTDLNENDCREVTVQYSFDGQSGNCQLIYISPDLEEKVLSDSSSGSVAIQLQAGANYIGITGTDYSGSIQITVE